MDKGRAGAVILCTIVICLTVVAVTYLVRSSAPDKPAPAPVPAPSRDVDRRLRELGEDVSDLRERLQRVESRLRIGSPGAAGSAVP